MSACNIEVSLWLASQFRKLVGFFQGFWIGNSCPVHLLTYHPIEKRACEKYPMALTCWAGSQDGMSLSCLFQLTGARISMHFLTAVWTTASYLFFLRDSLQRICEDVLGAFVSQRTGRLRLGLKPGNRDSCHLLPYIACFPLTPNLCREGKALSGDKEVHKDIYGAALFLLFL